VPDPVEEQLNWRDGLLSGGKPVVIERNDDGDVQVTDLAEHPELVAAHLAFKSVWDDRERLAAERDLLRLELQKLKAKKPPKEKS
jgi:hypothetical protein